MHFFALRSLRVGAMQRLPLRLPARRSEITIFTVAGSDSEYLNVVPFLWMVAATPNVGVRPPATANFHDERDNLLYIS